MAVNENELGEVVIGCAIEVHRELGPGLLESVYQKALAVELREAGLSLKEEVPVLIRYKNQDLDEGFRADIVVEDSLILELKAVEALRDVHKKQLQTYLKLTGFKLGYLLNFNTPVMRRGIVRCVNGASVPRR